MARDLYEKDFAGWAERNAALLRCGRVEEADIGHIAEEIEAMAKRERRELRRRLVRLMQHLLKWRMQPARRSPSWRLTILGQREALRDLLSDNRSLAPELEKLAAEAYPRAVRAASIETGLGESAFPGECPYGVERLLDDEFWPG